MQNIVKFKLRYETTVKWRKKNLKTLTFMGTRQK